MSKIKLVEHLYEIYPSMPRYANDSEESEVVKVYDFILRRFQGFYGHQPSYFVKASASPLLLGDQHSYVGYPYYSFSSTQDVIIAIAKSSSAKIRINNYQSAIYGEKVIESSVSSWKFNEKQDHDRFTNIFTKILTIIAEELDSKDLGGLDILIFTGYVEDEFMGWKQSLFTAFYVAITTLLTKNIEIDQKHIFNVIRKLTAIDNQLTERTQLTNYNVGYLSQQKSSKLLQIPFPENLNIVMAHSMTPLPKKLIQGKRFNLRRCEILIAIQYMKIVAGTNKQIKSLKQLQEFIGCTTEELIQQIEQNVPKGKLAAEDIEQYTQQSLIDILKEVPYANNVIDQNTAYFPRDRSLFFLREEILLNRLTSLNMVEILRESYGNQRELLGVGSQQIDQLIQVGKGLSLAHKIVGNGWGGNVLFVCEKEMSHKLVQALIKDFYLSKENRILLSDDLDQYIHIVEKPSTGLAILDPQSHLSQQLSGQTINQMLVVYFYPPPLPDYQLRPHREVVPSLVLLRQVKVRVSAALDPHVEASVVAPAPPHYLARSEELLGLALVHVEHEEEEFLGHFGDDGEVDHLVGGADGAAVGVLLGLLWGKVVVDFGEVGEGGVEHVVGDLEGLLGEEHYLLVKFLELVLEDRVVLADVEIVEVLDQGLHILLGEFAGGGEEPLAEHGELDLVVFEKVDIGLPLFVVLLVVLLFVEGVHFLLDGLEAGQNPTSPHEYFSLYSTFSSSLSTTTSGLSLSSISLIRFYCSCVDIFLPALPSSAIRTASPGYC